jgi:hypothetical protein
MNIKEASIRKIEGENLDGVTRSQPSQQSDKPERGNEIAVDSGHVPYVETAEPHRCPEHAVSCQL